MWQVEWCVENVEGSVTEFVVGELGLLKGVFLVHDGTIPLYEELLRQSSQRFHHSALLLREATSQVRERSHKRVRTYHVCPTPKPVVGTKTHVSMDSFVASAKEVTFLTS